MGGTIRARVRGGVLEPLERTDLPEGKEVLITVIGVAEDLDDEAFLRSAGSWKGLIDAEKFIRDVYEDRLLNTGSVKSSMKEP
ncbi:MAG: antitoxin family protein [Terriglobia bacterium]|jgi:predicted DNA-binding antitoxin AbrB/MazE fold protein